MLVSLLAPGNQISLTWSGERPNVEPLREADETVVVVWEEDSRIWYILLSTRLFLEMNSFLDVIGRTSDSLVSNG